MTLHPGLDFEQEFGGGIFGRAVNNQAAGAIAGRGPPVDEGIFGPGGIFGTNNFLGKGGTGHLLLGGVNTGFNIFDSIQKRRLASETFKFQKRAFRDQLADNRKAFDGVLKDTLVARGVAQNQPTSEVEAEFARRRLS